MINDRRKGPDGLVKVLKIISIIGWLLILFALIFSNISQPEMDTGLVRYKGIQIRDSWLIGWLYMAIAFMVVSALASIIAFIIHRKRSRRRGDLPRALIVIMALLSFLGVGVLVGIVI